MTTKARHIRQSAPLSDTIIVVVARLVADAKSGRREPSHSDLEFIINQCGLKPGDPCQNGQTLGKEKRVREVLSWALEYDYPAGEDLIARFISMLRAKGGFRKDSDNYVGLEAITNATVAFSSEGYVLGDDGELTTAVLEGLSGAALTEALGGYVRRAKRGSQDAALLTSTGKDLLEAVSAHILQERFGIYPSHANFPALLYQTFNALGLATTHDAANPGEIPQKRMERAMFETACAINYLRNKEGTGHGRPWNPLVTDSQARAAVEQMGTIAEWLLESHTTTK